MYVKILGLGVLVTILFSGILLAQESLVDREAEKQEFQSLHYTEQTWAKNIQQSYVYLAKFGYLLKLAKDDRARMLKAEREPLNFRHDHLELKYVPWRNSIRYVKEGEEFLFSTFGAVAEVKALVRERVAVARANKVTVPDLAISDREGIELSIFGFIYAKDPDKTRAIGSQRKWLVLYYAPGQAATGQLSAATLRVQYHNYQSGVKETELIIDPSPTDTQMDDIVILHRYNHDVSKVYLVGLMHNNKSFAHRNEFKSKYNDFLRNHFLQMFQRIAKYNSHHSHESHNKHFNRLDRGLSY